MDYWLSAHRAPSASLFLFTMESRTLAILHIRKNQVCSSIPFR